MDWLKENWDKATLIAVGIIAIALSVLFGLKAQAYPSTFEMERTTPNNEIPQADTAKVESARQFLDEEIKWVLPIKGEEAPKPLPLFVSVPIVEIGGDLIDMNDPNAKAVRPPATNKWLLENRLDYLDAGIMQQDIDGDEFSNEEEWDAKTDPRDPNSHPSYTDKLHLVARRQQSYVLLFQTMPDDKRFQIRRLPSAAHAGQENFMMTAGETSSDGMFRVESVEKAEGKNDLGITVDQSKLTITYLPTGEKKILTRGLEETIPTYYAEFEFELAGGSKFFVKQGDPFVLPVDSETKYKLVDIQEQEAEISYMAEPGKEVTVKITPKN